MPAAEDMIRNLVKGQEAVVRTARSVIRAAEAASDEPTADLLTQRMQVHEKVWVRIERARGGRAAGLAA